LFRKTVLTIQQLLDSEFISGSSSSIRRCIRGITPGYEGANAAWYCDSDDKLTRYGLAIWGIRDRFSQKWLKLWVIPRDGIWPAIVYLWLSLVRDIKGK
jgi:hypothetical protein